MGQAVQWRYPRVLYARAPRLDPRSARRPYKWRWYLAPMWREETGQPLWRPTWHGRVECWDDPAAWWFLRPLRRLTRQRGGTWPTRSTPSSLWSPMCGGPPCRSRGRFMPRPGGPTSSAVLSRGPTGTSCTRSSKKLSASLGNGSRAAPRVRGRPPCRLPVAGLHLPLQRPLHRPARPLWGDDRIRPPDHGAAGLGSEINLHALLPLWPHPLRPLTIGG